jgi:hypothetical protein
VYAEWRIYPSYLVGSMRLTVDPLLLAVLASGLGIGTELRCPGVMPATPPHSVKLEAQEAQDAQKRHASAERWMGRIG